MAHHSLLKTPGHVRLSSLLISQVLSTDLSVADSTPTKKDGTDGLEPSAIIVGYLLRVSITKDLRLQQSLAYKKLRHSFC